MTWQRLCRIDEIPSDDVLPLEVGGRPLAVCAVEGGYFAFHDRCTHEDVSLSNGFLEGCEIECPLHGSRFDLRSGKCLSPPATDDLRVYATKVEEGALYAELPDATGSG